MRPAYRYALAAGVATLVAMLLGLWISIPESVDPIEPTEIVAKEDRVRLPVRPERLEPLQAPVVGDPGKEARADLLDEIELMEAETLGASEAARRRRAREQLLDGRLDPR